MISVVIPLYNKEKQLKKTLDSVFNQTYQDFEIVVVDDGSTDSSLSVLNRFEDKRIRLIRQENQGVSAARNHAILEAKSEWVALLDADDEWEPDYLSTQVDLIRKYKECDVFACAYAFKDYLGNKKSLILNKLPFEGESGILDNYFEVAACSHPPICSINIVARKSAFQAIGGFPIGVKAGEDLLTWARLAIRFRIAYNKTPKAYFIQSPAESYVGGPSRVPDPDDVVGKELIDLYRKSSHVKGLRKYISLWYKMRASMFLLLNKKSNAFQASVKSLKYDLLNFKVWVYLVLLFFPKSLRHKVFQQFGH